MPVYDFLKKIEIRRSQCGEKIHFPMREYVGDGQVYEYFSVSSNHTNSIVPKFIYDPIVWVPVDCQSVGDFTIDELKKQILTILQNTDDLYEEFYTIGESEIAINDSNDFDSIFEHCCKMMFGKNWVEDDPEVKRKHWQSVSSAEKTNSDSNGL